uniref:Thioredoxin family protein n=1 Tax=Oryza sativa subsp. japonica TaxID=39947 RepID=Q2QTX2_ORYSJ|nr:Thioredoxin family protein [Oryza sativa Japonica Group]
MVCGKLVVIEFGASWCEPSRRIAPVFAEYAKEFAGVVFLKFDIDELEEIADSYDVNGVVPTFTFVKAGQKIDMIQGARRRSRPGLTDEDVGVLRGRECDIPAQGLKRINRILIPTSCNFFSGSRSRKNSKVTSWVHKNFLNSSRVLVCVLLKLPDVTGPGLECGASHQVSPFEDSNAHCFSLLPGFIRTFLLSLRDEVEQLVVVILRSGP